MDFNAFWTVVGDRSNSARRVVRSGTAAGLDTVTPLFVPLVTWWDQEAARREALRTPENLKSLIEAQRHHGSARATASQASTQRAIARKQSQNPFSGQRRAARVSHRAARAHHDTARAALRTARKNYPARLRTRAVQAHLALAAVAALAVWLLSLHAPLNLDPAWAFAALAGLHGAAQWLGRRQPVALEIDGDMSAEERQLMARLDPAWWVANAPERGLAGTVTTPPEMTAGGIRVEIRLDGTWTVKGLVDKTDNLRALLGARTALRIRITSAKRGGWALLTLATRSAADGVSSTWTPDLIPKDWRQMSLGLDTETGEPVLVPFDERVLVSGASGTGKSWSTRPLMAHAHLVGDLVLIDGKGEEANIWEKRCRVARSSDEAGQVVDEAHALMKQRADDMRQRGISVWDGTQLTLFVDEGQVVLAMPSIRDKARLQRLIELSSLGRSRGVVLWWATQYPVTDGGAPGVHKMIAPNLLTRFSLRVAGTTQAQVALDDCAHYAPHQIPEGREYRGHGYLKGYGPRLLRTWTMTDGDILKLPEKFWQLNSPIPQDAVPVPFQPGERHLRVVGATQEWDEDDAQESVYLADAVPADKVPASRPGQLNDTDVQVIEAVRALRPPVRQVDIVGVTKIAQGTVSKAVKRLVTAGVLIRHEDGSVSLAAPQEVAQ